MLFNIGKHEVAVILCAFAVLFIGVPAMMEIAAWVLHRSIAKLRDGRRSGPAGGSEPAVRRRIRVGIRGKDRR